MKEGIFKCFGVSKSDVKSLLSSLIENSNGVEYEIEGENLLITIKLSAPENNFAFFDWTRLIFEKLSQYIYAETDISLEETVFELLKMRKLTLATAESITGGQIVSSLIKKNLGASSVVVEGLVTYANEAKMNRLGVSQQTLNQQTSVSVQTTYDMAKGLLETSSASIAIATTGYATSVQQSETAGLVYIAIGNRNRIDVYKNKFSGTREEVIETAANAALFYLIKKLRKNDFDF